MKRIGQAQESNDSAHIGRHAAGAAVVLGALLTATQAFAVEYADVVSSTPVTGQFGVPTQQCQDVPQAYTPPTSGIGAVLGTVAGAVVGNAVGGGAGRALATGAGAIGGAVLGDRVEANGNQPSTVLTRQCQNGMSYESRVVGYDVTYEYRGQRYTTRLPQDPGKRLALNVSVSPAAAGDIAQPQGAWQPPGATVQQADVPIGIPVGGTVQPAPVYYPAAPYYAAPVYAAPVYAPPPVWVQPSLFIGVGGGGRGHWR